MKFISTRQQSAPVDFKEALLQGIAPDGGLYIPSEFPHLSESVFKNLSQDASLFYLARVIIDNFLPEIPHDELLHIISKTLTFPIPLVALQENLFLLEVFHGPTLAFKDVGARFMANMLSYYLEQEAQKITILVATSGDTGSAIAHGFYGMPNIDVYILYPSEKISFLQEQQMTTLGGNIHALEVMGTFDTCQELVKKALLDEEIKTQHQLTTANSINIARLLPQIIYHAWGVMQLHHKELAADPRLVVPSGNFGNLVAAIYAKVIGFPIHQFVAATNLNAIVPNYLKSGEFTPLPSQHSFSNAMDVGNPSNFERLSAIYGGSHTKMARQIRGVAISDDETILEIRRTYDATGYILDPHTAVGVAAAKKFPCDNRPSIVTATAHPAKFPEVIMRALQMNIELPDVLQKTLHQTKQATKISSDYTQFKSILMQI